MANYDMSIHTNPDAAAWARLYTETRNKSADPANFDSEDNMLGWFANAMMAMHDHLTGQNVIVLDDGSAFFIADVPAHSPSSPDRGKA
jgi:hypothetical protein